jgi:hypothetical protein
MRKFSVWYYVCSGSLEGWDCDTVEAETPEEAYASVVRGWSRHRYDATKVVEIFDEAKK